MEGRNHGSRRADGRVMSDWLANARLRRALLPGLLLPALLAPIKPALAQSPGGITELLRQQERERVLRQQQETLPEARAPLTPPPSLEQIPADETPCFFISQIRLTGPAARRFTWALKAAETPDPASGRCLGANGIGVVIARMQNALIASGYITTRISATPQDLKPGVLLLTVVPGHIRHIRFASGASLKATAWNAVPARRGDLLNLRDVEQALENFQRVPTVQADIQIVPADGENADNGQSDLVITWRQRSPPLRLAVTLDDAGGKTTGKLQGGLTLSLDDLLMLNDLLYVSLNHDVLNTHGQGAQGRTAHYSVPYGYWTLSATASAYQYRQTVSGHSQNYVYQGASDNTSLQLSRLLYRDAQRKATLYARGWTRRSRNSIDGVEIEVQRRHTSGWEAGLTHREYLGASTLDASLAYRHGTSAFGALPAPEEAFGEGASRMQIITADAQIIHPLSLGPLHGRYLGSWRAQWDRTPLVPQDRFSIGGRYSVRGFDGELTLMGERGWFWRNELGILLGAGQELYAGADYGHVGGASARWLKGRGLAGAVIGLRGDVKGFHWDIFAGTPLHKPPGFQSGSLTTGFTLGWSC